MATSFLLTMGPDYNDGTTFRILLQYTALFFQIFLTVKDQRHCKKYILTSKR